MNKFHKVSYEQFKKDLEANCNLSGVNEESIKKIYDDIKMPKRSTKGSAGYDFFAPISIYLTRKAHTVIPTGIRMEMEPDRVLMCFPRSGLGFKYRMQLDNTVGVIDSDYFYSDNECHIMIKIANDGYEDKVVEVEKGKAFAQGVLMSFYLTDDDDSDGIRNGGMGSTDEENK